MKHSNFLTRLAACSALALSATAANAELLNFTLTGDYTASWQIESTRAPDDSTDGFAVFYDVEGFPETLFGVADIYFYNVSIGGGLEIYDFYGGSTLVATDGPQLYTGTEDAPTFLLGTFALTEFLGTGTYTLTIANAAAVVPEPASVAMLLAGLGVVGGVAARRRKTEAAEAAIPA